MTLRLPPAGPPILGCALLALALAAPPVAARLTLMHGYADVTSAALWIQADAPGPIEVAWTPEGDATPRRATFDATAANENVIVARLGGLAPGRRAAYRVAGDGDVREGTVRAQPYWTKAADAPEFSIALGSCFFLGDANPLFSRPGYGGGFEIFSAIAAQKPDLMLWLGDNLYFQTPDFLDPAALSARHRRQRTFEPLQPVLTATSHLAIWDDHDYGPNDGDRSYALKGETLKLFRRYWANPSWGLPETPGVFGFAQYGDVEMFLLDGRYHRASNRAPDGPGKTMFGRAQLEWLKAALLRSRAPVKIIAGGSQFWNRASRFEGWHRFPTEQKAFAAWLAEQRINGVIFVSGDRHFTELLRIERPGAYPLYEFTSSPLTSRPWEQPDLAERENPDVVPGTLVGKRQFGMIRVSGPGNDRRVALESYDATGARLWRHEIRARDLRMPRRSPAPEVAPGASSAATAAPAAAAETDDE
jgi:alkaline phosphatase D